MNELPTELADIIEPAAPVVAASANAAWIAAVVALTVFAVTGLMWWRRSATRRRGLRRLRRLRREFSAGSIDARGLAYRVAAELRTCLRMVRLRATVAPAPGHAPPRDSWRDFIAQLDALRYRPAAGIDAAQVERLLRAGAYWLRRAR